MFTFKQAQSFLRAVLSGRDKTLQAERDAVCDGCDQYVERPAKTIWGKWKMQGFCKACGCGQRPMADMNGGKNAFRDMKCPIAKWPGDAESMGLTLKEVNALYGAKDRLEYNMASVQNLIDKQKPMDPALQAMIFGQPLASAPPSAGKAAAGVADASRPQALPAKQCRRPTPCKSRSPKPKPLRDPQDALANAQHENLASA